MRFYGIDMDSIGSAVSVRTAAACAVCLPRHSAVMARLHPKSSVGYAEVMLNAIASCMTGRKIPYPWEKAETKNDGALPEFKSSDVDDFDAWYARLEIDRSEKWQTQ